MQLISEDCIIRSLLEEVTQATSTKADWKLLQRVFNCVQAVSYST